ncbi:galactose-3-O-sulfotransferase 2-like [Physella acuta]|uniref:galactose-3-O-sulfotransferase 2-like n=1 Tax=Physella acuta TaxID=109671 RepID=UPI0027DD50B3|nr:galactose-3-O-sulfotransferase 2-like [Physella acuta]
MHIRSININYDVMRMIRKIKCCCLCVFTMCLTLWLIFTLPLDHINAILPTKSRDLAQHGIRRDDPGRLPPFCDPATNLAFVKVHKAGSSTVATLLQRFGIVHGLNFALPNRPFHDKFYNYITRPGEILTRDSVVPLPPGKQYNILLNHAIYNRTAFRQLMPENTVYLTILREPFQQFVSAFEYYNMASYFSSMVPSVRNASNPISLYLSDPHAFEGESTLFSYIRNKQSEDLGLTRAAYDSPLVLNSSINIIDREFLLVMIVERLDESLLLLKRELCWSVKDILYISKNANTKKAKRSFTPSDHDNHRKLNHPDYALYGHFLKVLENKLDAQSADFFSELKQFQFLLKGVKQACLTTASFYAAESRWHDSFNVTQEDCKLLLMSVTAGLDYLLLRAGRITLQEYQKYRPHKPLWQEKTVHNL